MTCVTGVSGSGKSTLVIDTLHKTLSQRLYRSREKAGAVRDVQGLELPGQGHQHRPVPHRPHPALQPGHLHRRLHRHPRPVRPAAGIQAARLQAGALLLQCQGGALRGLLRRRHHQDRDALPAGCLCPVRGLQGGALQPRDPGGALQGEIHRRGAGHDRLPGAGVHGEHPAHQEQAEDPGGGRARLHQAGPVGHHPLRRRGPAGQAVQGAVQARHRPDHLHPGRTDHRPAFRTTSPSCWRCCTGWWRRATPS